MNKKKILAVAVALVLVCAVAVSGTLAYLTRSGVSITNTFIADGGGELINPEDDPTLPGVFKIEEPVYEKQEDGTYSATSSNTDTGNTYEVEPGVSYPKDPVVILQGKTTVPAYFYIEVCDALDSDIFSWEIADGWAPLMTEDDVPVQVKGNNDGYIYVLVDNSGAPVIVAEGDDGTFDLIKDGKVDVDADTTTSQLATIGSTGQSLEFYAYLGQASAGTDALSAFQNCFPAA